MNNGAVLQVGILMTRKVRELATARVEEMV